VNTSEGGAELCRVHIASGPTFRRQKKDFPERESSVSLELKCNQSWEVPGPLSGRRDYGERSCPALRSPDENCVVLVLTCDLRLLIQHTSFWSDRRCPVPCPSESCPICCTEGAAGMEEQVVFEGCAELLSGARARHSQLCCAASQTRDQHRPLLHQGCFIPTS